jgi:hypothetical protein
MKQPINFDDLFRFAPEWNVDWDEQNKTITIDNFYEDPDAIYEWLQQQDYPRWKYFGEDTTRNGKDYDDCRLIHSWSYYQKQFTMDYFGCLLDICRRFFWKGHYTFDQVFEFNCFRALKKFDNTVQHFPHLDDDMRTPDEQSVLNLIVFMDKDGNGGTDIYEGNFPDNKEHENLMFEFDPEKHKTIRRMKHKFNRAVIFAGNRMHGAVIDDYEHYMSNWRYSQVYFLYPERQRFDDRRDD